MLTTDEAIAAKRQIIEQWEAGGDVPLLTDEPCVCGHLMNEHKVLWDMWGEEPDAYPGECLVAGCRRCV